jgi:exonuclease 3'-5' domain-containing protein 1
LNEDLLTSTATERCATAPTLENTCVKSSDKTDVIEIIQETELHEAPPSGLIDTFAAIALLVESLSDLPNHPPSIYVDLEGINLSRHGTISILQIYVLPIDRTYLVDVHILRGEAFSTVAKNGHTLKSILESEHISKAFFDIRNDSDALYSLYGIRVAGICDIQLMELATRSFSKRCISGLVKCIERDLTMTARERQNWRAKKERGVKLFAPEHGGSYEVFNSRPLSEEVKEYCMQDVQLLPRLWLHYSPMLEPSWKRKVEDATKDRIKLSQSAYFNGEGRHMALGPWN